MNGCGGTARILGRGFLFFFCLLISLALPTTYVLLTDRNTSLSNHTIGAMLHFFCLGFGDHVAEVQANHDSIPRNRGIVHSHAARYDLH